MVKKLKKIKTQFEQKHIDACDAVALTLLTHLFHHSPHLYQGVRLSPFQTKGPTSQININDFDLPSLKGENSLWKIYSHFRLKGVEERINKVLCQWKLGSIELILTESIPTAAEMLHLQTKGQRYVSVFWSEDRIGSQITPSKDDFHFTLHDLEHAERFLTEDHRGQIAFFKKLSSWNSQFKQEPFFKDPNFQEELTYLMSDMNTHPAHQRAYLLAILINSLKKVSAKSDQHQPIDYKQIADQLLQDFNTSLF